MGCEACTSSRPWWSSQLTGSYLPEAVDDDARDDAETLQAYLLGLSIRRALDPDLTQERAADLLRRLLASLHRTASATE